MRKKAFKFIIIYVGILYLLIAALPYGAHLVQGQAKEPEAPVVVSRFSQKETTPPAFAETIALLEEEPAEATPKTTFRILDTANKKILSVEARDFLFGALACEMTPSVPTEALKAQTVAIYSYYSRLRGKGETYDFTCNSKEFYTYAPKSAFMKSWGDEAEENAALLESAIDAVYGQYLSYGEEIACTSYFSVSNGRTESAADIWGKNFPYLISVASPYDMISPTYETTKAFAPEQIQKIMETTWPKARYDFTLPYDQWFSDLTYTLGGSVLSVNICTFSITGNEARSSFGLKSSTFAVDYIGNQFVFRVKGSGHGVGMSQTGAAYMAAEGSTYSEILSWYYPGTTLQKS